MTTRVTRVDIDAVQPQRWRIGLLEGSGAQQLPPGAISRLAGGIGYQTFDPGFDPDVGSTFDPCDDFTVAEGEGTERQWNAWGIAIGEECSTLNAADGTIEAMEARAEARLQAQSSYLAEYTFWTGLVGGTLFSAIAPTAWPNIPLVDPSLTDLTPSDTEAGVVEAFGLIHEYLSDTLRGLRGVIHVAPQILPYLAFYGVAQRDGFTLGTTLGDHLIIAGSGYQGTGPSNIAVPDNRTWIYATSMVRVGASPIEVRADYTREQNTAHAIAYRAVLAEWDRHAHAGLRVCLTDPGPTCAAEGS